MCGWDIIATLPLPDQDTIIGVFKNLSPHSQTVFLAQISFLDPAYYRDIALAVANLHVVF